MQAGHKCRSGSFPTVTGQTDRRTADRYIIRLSLDAVSVTINAWKAVTTPTTDMYTDDVVVTTVGRLTRGQSNLTKAAS